MMPHLPRAAALLALLLLLSGCGSRQADPAAGAAQPFVGTAPDGQTVLRMQIDLPEADSSLSGQAADAIERYYDTVNDELSRWQAELNDLALADYEQAEQAGAVFRPYSVEEGYTVVRCDAAYFSVVRSRVSYTGGAQEEQTVTCEVFDASSGALLALDDLFVPGSDYADVLLAQLTRALETRSQAEPGLFYDDAQAQLAQAFEAGRFSLSDDALTFFYPTYTLAPSSAGVISFDIPLSALADIMT